MRASVSARIVGFEQLQDAAKLLVSNTPKYNEEVADSGAIRVESTSEIRIARKIAMSTAFAHSLRSLQADRNRFSLVALSLAGLLLLGWLIWFFFAQVTLYETGQIVQTSSDGVVVAHFPLTAQTRLQAGQAVQLQLAGAEPQAVIPATVAEVAQHPTADQIQVVIYADMDSPQVAALRAGLTGQASVAVEILSPATLVMRASGQGVDTPPASFGPAE
jgi:hypothetical protein